jgi:predicted  nucleic acid-binding Zn-ribbon protein
MLHLSYFDKEEGYLGDKEYTHSIDIRALTRKSRDLIVLSIRCFSALNSYKNSKVIEMLNLDDDKSDFSKLEIESISDLLIEQDSVKRELYEQININKGVKTEKDKCLQEYRDLEVQMNSTIESYQSVIESTLMESNGDSFQYKKQLVQEQNMNEKLQVELGGLNERILVLNDENKTLMRKAENQETAITKLNKKIHKYKNQNGVPHSQVKKMEDALAISHEEIDTLKAMLAKYDRASKTDKSKMKQMEQQMSNLNY